MSTPAENALGKSKAGKRTSRILPTDRITFPKQLNLLRAWAAASGHTNKIVVNDEVARIVKMVESTVSMANSFFTDVGFLQKQPDSGFIPASELASFNLAYEWNPETAAHKLAPLIEQTWFAQAIMPRLGYGPMPEEEAIEVLAQAANASPEKKGQLFLLLEYMKSAGMISEENGSIRRTRNGVQASNAEYTDPRPQPMADPAPDPLPPRSASVMTAFTVPTEGVVQFHVSVRVDMREFSNWEADRIGAFFGGIADVLKAKAGIEKGESPAR